MERQDEERIYDPTFDVQVVERNDDDDDDDDFENRSRSVFSCCHDYYFNRGDSGGMA